MSGRQDKEDLRRLLAAQGVVLSEARLDDAIAEYADLLQKIALVRAAVRALDAQGLE